MYNLHMYLKYFCNEDKEGIYNFGLRLCDTLP